MPLEMREVEEVMGIGISVGKEIHKIIIAE